MPSRHRNADLVNPAEETCAYMAKTLILYHGIYGHTRKIAETIESELHRLGGAADLVPITEWNVDEAGRYQTIVIGAAIRNGKHNRVVLEFIRKHRALLESKHNAFFSVNLVARKAEKNTAETNPYVKAFLNRSPWQPQLVGVIAGNLDYQRYRFFDRHVIRFIMTLTGGPTDLNTKVEFTDWDRVRSFAAEIAALSTAGGA
ncbi:MAG: menaquinone-dependent protoporphyrinogen IX dehydrogenase [Chromatiales bacterium]